MSEKKIAFFPYGIAEENPYQKLLKEALEVNPDQELKVAKWPGNKWFPYIKLWFKEADIIHHFWPHDFYLGRNKFSSILKSISFQISLPFLANRKMVYSIENIVSHDSTNFDLEVKLIQKLINKANGLVFMSKASMQLFVKHYSIPKFCKTLILPHINYVSHYKNTISRTQARKKFNLEANDKVLLSLGRVDPYKGITKLINAFISCANKKSVLIIAGKCPDNEYLSEIKNLIIKARKMGLRIIFDNCFIKDDDIQYYMNASDATVLNYEDIPMNPGSLIMAMGFGCSVLAPNLGAIPEIIPKESYFGFKHGNSRSLKNAILDFLSADNLEERSKIAKDHIVNNHSKELVNNKLIEFYKLIKK